MSFFSPRHRVFFAPSSRIESSGQWVKKNTLSTLPTMDFWSENKRCILKKTHMRQKKTKKGTSREENISPGYSSHGWEWDFSMSETIGERNSCIVHVPLTGRNFFPLEVRL